MPNRTSAQVRPIIKKVMIGVVLLSIGYIVGWVSGGIRLALRHAVRVEKAHDFYHLLCDQYLPGQSLESSLQKAKARYKLDFPTDPPIEDILINEDHSSAAICFKDSNGYFYLGVWKVDDSLNWSVTQ